MEQKIIGFCQNLENKWIAQLACGHWHAFKESHESTGLSEKIGTTLECSRCEEMGQHLAKAVLSECREVLFDAYESAGFSGLCAEGRWEVALDSLKQIDLKELVGRCLGSLRPLSRKES